MTARTGGRLRKRWWLVGLPAAGFTALVLLAPPLPRPSVGGAAQRSPAQLSPFHYGATAEAYTLQLDPRQVRLDLDEGWDREQQAYGDSSALAYVSGPMYETIHAAGKERTVPLGDVKLGDRLWMASNRSAAQQRAFLGIRHDGGVEFGYGELTAARRARYDTFLGGLHSLYNDLEPPPASYKGAYSVGMGQQIRYYLPRIRVVYGLQRDGQLQIFMSREGLTLEETQALARQRGLVAAYLPDHASKSRLIVPGVKAFTAEDANWISGGATSFVHVPYMVRLSRRVVPLSTSPLEALGAGLHLREGREGMAEVMPQLLQRALAGFNRVMEQGVVPMARLLLGPRGRWWPAREKRGPPCANP